MVAGLFVRGDRESQRMRIQARAIELGINHFDTAPLYGDGKSEQNLGQVLAENPGEYVIGTKIEYYDQHFADFRSWTLKVD